MVLAVRPTQEDLISVSGFGSPRCMLFFPASRPEMYEKAARSGAHAVCMDLEDSVAAGGKNAARSFATLALGRARPNGTDLVIRINHPSTAAGEADLAAIAGALDAGAPAARDGGLALMIPKVGAPEEVEAIRGRLSAHDLGVGLIPMIETVRGLARVEEIAAMESVRALLFGGLDLSIELGAELAWEPLLYARSRFVHAARLAGVGALDMPWLDVSDRTGLEAEARRVRALGFTGKAAIHPDQVGTVLDAFSPSEREIAYARRVVEAAAAAPVGAFLLDGAMVDRPVVEAARRTLERTADLSRTRGVGA
jgi:citrate lyase beta subunit